MEELGGGGRGGIRGKWRGGGGGRKWILGGRRLDCGR